MCRAASAVLRRAWRLAMPRSIRGGDGGTGDGEEGDSVPAAGPPATPATAGAPADSDPTALARARADLADRLWGEGFALPGGRQEVERLAALLPLSPATTLLLVGLDAGGAAEAIARGRGAWVAAHQHDPALAARMAARLRPLGRRATVERWDPAAPAFRARFHHHALAIEALRPAAAAERDAAALLAALAAALKPGGQLVLLEAVADRPEACPARWLALEGRLTPPPSAAALEAALGAAGFVVHVTEDTGARHLAAALEAWSRLLGTLSGLGRSRLLAEAAVAEAETWLLRQRLIASGALRLLRWHASLPPAG